jgi:hypothetical protein
MPFGPVMADRRGMTRRTLVAAMWFGAFALAGEVLWSIGATPRPLGLVVAAAIAGFVWLDPIQQLHPRPAQRADIGPAPRPGEAQLLPR